MDGVVSNANLTGELYLTFGAQKYRIETQNKIWGKE